MKTTAILLICVLSLASLAGESETPRTLLGADVVKAIEEAQSTETYRLSGEYKLDQDPANWKKGPVWDAGKTREIATALLSEKSYVLGMAKPCKPRFGVLLRLVSGEKKIDIRICFECTMMMLSSENPKLHTVFHFEPSRSKWSGWAKQAFPDDAVLQGLKEKDMPWDEVERIQKEYEKMRRELEEKKVKEAKP